MGEVVFAECGIVAPQACDALVAYSWSLHGQNGGVGDGLYAFAMFSPLLQCLFLFALCCHTRLLYAHLLRDVEILILVDGLDEFGGYLGVNSGTVFNPFGECHEYLDGIYHVSFLVEFFDDGR